MSDVKVTAQGSNDDVQGFKVAARKIKLTAETKTQPPPVNHTDTTVVLVGYTKQQYDDAKGEEWSSGYTWGWGSASGVFIAALVGLFLLRSKFDFIKKLFSKE